MKLLHLDNRYFFSAKSNGGETSRKRGDIFSRIQEDVFSASTSFAIVLGN